MGKGRRSNLRFLFIVMIAVLFGCCVPGFHHLQRPNQAPCGRKLTLLKKAGKGSENITTSTTHLATSPVDHTAPDIAFRIFRQRFSRQMGAIIREDSNKCRIVPMWEYETHQVR
ncbi:hypothetical protein B0H13DRAFT_2012434 [Mycena leptocephala]|nr:hypothetical protein B0H13DRAFT_2012434 [Mycena leptocephala]